MHPPHFPPPSCAPIIHPACHGVTLQECAQLLVVPKARRHNAAALEHVVQQHVVCNLRAHSRYAHTSSAECVVYRCKDGDVTVERIVHP